MSVVFSCDLCHNTYWQHEDEGPAYTMVSDKKACHDCFEQEKSMLWLHKIDLHEVLRKADDEFDLSRHEEECPHDVKEMLAAEIRKAPPIANYAQKVLNARSIAGVNRVLERLYNEADQKRVWCGI